MPEPVNVALAQTTSTDDFAANAAYAESLVARAAGAGAELVAFPEVVFLVAGRTRKLECAESLDGPTLSRFRIAAPAQWGRHNPRYASYGHSLMVDPRGRVTARLPEGNGLVHAPFDLGLLRKIRHELPMGRDVEGENPWI